MKDRKPDAIRSPLSFAGPGDSWSRLARLQAEFAEVLRAGRVHVRHQGSEHFITGDPADSLNYPSDSPNSGRPRYDWEARPDGVVLGYLKADA